MTEKKMLYSAFTKIAFGNLFILISLNIMGFDIMPDFVGYILFISAFSELCEKYKGFRNLSPFAVILMVWSIVSLIIPAFSDIDAITVISRIASIVIGIIHLYFAFQMFTEISFIAKEYQPEDITYDIKLIKLRNIYTVLDAVLTVSTSVPILLNYIDNPILSAITVILTLITVVVVIIIAYTLFCIRKLFADDSPTPDYPEPEPSKPEYPTPDTVIAEKEEKDIPTEE